MGQQTDYNHSNGLSIDGQILDGRPSVIESPAAFEGVAFGRGIVSANGSDSVRTPRRNTAAIVEDGDLVTSNKVNGKINGVAIAEVTFASTHAATQALVKTAIETVLTGLGITATVTVGGASNRTITIVAEDANILFSDWAVTAGSSQAGITHTYTTADPFRGVAAVTQKQPHAGVARYEATETVHCLRRGLVAVRVNGAVAAADSDAYLVVATSGKEGYFTTTSTGNIGPVGKFRSTAADQGLAKLELNLP